MGATQEIRSAQALEKACQEFSIVTDLSCVVQNLSFADLLKDPSTCSEHYLALVTRDTVLKPTVSYTETRWMSINDMVELKWLRFRLTLVRQVATVLRCIEEHYQGMSKLATASPEDMEMISKIRDAEEISQIARQIVGDAGRQDLLFGVTVASLRINNSLDPEWYNANGVNWLLDSEHQKALTIAGVNKLATLHRGIDRVLMAEYADAGCWYAGVKEMANVYAMLHMSTLGQVPHQYLSEVWYIVSDRLAKLCL